MRDDRRRAGGTLERDDLIDDGERAPGRFFPRQRPRSLDSLFAQASAREFRAL